MKKAKILATVLSAAMMLTALAGATLFSVSAAEGFDYSTTHEIDSVEEYVDFVKAINAGTYTDNSDHKVNCNLDLSGYPAEDVVMKKMVNDMAIDYQGHTVSGIVREVTLTEHGNAGLIADEAAGYAEILNVKIKDCKLTVTMENGRWGMVGAVLGFSDRAYVNGADLENVTIELSGSGAVGAVYGHKQYSDARPDTVEVSMKNVVINAPNASVGLIVGRQSDDPQWGASKIIVKKLVVSDTTVTAGNEGGVKEDTYAGTGDFNNGAERMVVADDAVLSVQFVDNATGYAPAGSGDTGSGDTGSGDTGSGDTGSGDTGSGDTGSGDTGSGDTGSGDTGSGDSGNESPKTGSASIVIAAVAVAALAGAAIASKKRDLAE